MTGEDVRYMQRFVGERRYGSADGNFGPHATEDVLCYQKMRGIAVTGVRDKGTWHNLCVTPTY
jgi:hypothetical protein